MSALDSLFGDDAAVLDDRSFQLLLLANLLPPLGTALLSPVLDSLIDPFGTTPANIGLMMSFFTAPPILVIPLAGVLADRYGRKPVIVGSLLLFGGAGSAIALTTNFRVALGLRLLQGAAFGGLTPVIITSIGDLYAGTREATAQGLRFTGSGLAQTAFPLLAGLVVTLAWQLPFLIYAMAFPVALLVALRFEEPARPTETETTTDEREGSYARELFALVRTPRVLSLVLARGLPIVVWIAFLTYNSIIVVQIQGGTPGEAGLLVALGSLAYAAAASQAGRITALVDSRFVPLIAAHAGLAAGFVVVLYAPGVVIAGAGIVLSGAGFGTALSLYRSIVTSLAPQELRAGVVSLAEANGRLVATLTPILMGAAIGMAEPRVGFRTALRLSGIGAAIVGSAGGVFCLLVAKLSPKTAAERADK
ncbi:MFS transporter [Halovenus sp. HT40]|uniref:MFS transporter n=1 Tax=Halovenus sp. HT40 TaxID=3126691 RepID=UPI00300EF0A6